MTDCVKDLVMFKTRRHQFTHAKPGIGWPFGDRSRYVGSRLAFILLLTMPILTVVPIVSAFADEPVEFKGHQEVVYDAAFLPDGKSLVTASFDQTLKLWDVATQAVLRTMEGHTGIVLTVDVSPDGRLIASGSSDRTIRLWDVPISTPISTRKVHDSPATAMAASRDGSLIATADEKGLVRIWPGTTAKDANGNAAPDDGKPTIEVNVGAPVSSLAWRNDNGQLAVASTDGTLRLIRPGDGAVIGPVGAHDGDVTGLAISPNNQQIFTAGIDGYVRRWPTNMPTPLEFEGLGKPAKAVALHPNGSLIAVAGEGGSAKILKRADGSIVHTLEGLTGTINDIAFNRSNNQLATIGEDQIVRVFDVTSGKLLQESMPAKTPLTSVMFSTNSKEVIVGTERGDVLAHAQEEGAKFRSLSKRPQAVRSIAMTTDGLRIVYAGDGAILWVRDTKTEKTTQGAKLKAAVSAVTISSNNSVIAVGHADGTVVTLDATTFDPTGEFTGHAGPVTGLAFNTTGTHLVSSSADGTARLWDLKAAALAQHFTGHGGEVAGIAFQNDNKSIITAGADGKVRVETVANQISHRADDGQVNDLSLAANGSQYATAGADGTVKLWAASNSTPTRSFTGIEGPALCVSLSADNRQIAAGGSDKTIRTWNIANAAGYFRLNTPAEPRRVTFSPNSTRLIASLADNTIQCFDPTPLNPQPAEPPAREASQTLSGHTADITSVGWSSDSLTLYSTSTDMTLREWSIASPTEKARLSGHSQQVYAVAFSPDGKILASASADKTVRLWDPETGKAVKTLATYPAPVYGLAFSSDGQQIAIAGADNTVRLVTVSNGSQVRLFTGPEHPVYSVTFSPDDKQIAAAGMGIGSARNIFVWNVDASEPAAVLSGHQDDIYQTQFNADGSKLLSIGYSGSLRIWDPGSQKPLYEQNLGVVSYSGSLSPDGSQVVVTSNDRTARLMSIPETAR